MLLLRILSSLIGIPLLILVGIVDGITLKLCMFLLASFAYFEFIKAVYGKNDVFDYISYIYIAVVFYLEKGVTESTFFLFIYIYLILLMLIALIRKNDTNAIFPRFTGFVYTVIPFILLVKIRYINSWYFWLTFVISFSTDTFAYFTGKYLGKRKLCPTISPNKTVAGFFGGIIGCILTVYVYVSFFLNRSWDFFAIAIVGSIISQIGDLSASLIKRNYKIKDFGSIIPGHGGILDRFDSILFVSVIIYFIILLK